MLIGAKFHTVYGLCGLASVTGRPTASLLRSAAGATLSMASGGVPRSSPRFIDIAVNLTDEVFRGNYHGKQSHDDDFQQVMQRARSAGVVAQIVTAGSLAEAKAAAKLCAEASDLVCTTGCHPTRSQEFDKHPSGQSGYLTELDAFVAENAAPRGKVVAIGECGLDYDRLHFSPAEVQRKHFETQLGLAVKHKLPLFLHSRAAAQDFKAIMCSHLGALEEAMATVTTEPAPVVAQSNQVEGTWPKRTRVGVVHSFTGSSEEMLELVELGLFIGVNGCSMKTEENLEVIKAIPLSHLMLETDAPWCEIRPSHASAKLLGSNSELPYQLAPAVKKEKHVVDRNEMVKGRCEPCTMVQVAAVVAKLKGVSVDILADVVERNTRWLFNL